MTIKEAAAKYGVSTQAIYKRLKTAGVEVATIVEGDKNELSPDGEAVLLKLYGGESQEKRESINQQNAKLVETVKELNQEINRLSQLVDTLKNQVDELRADKAQLSKLLEQAQSLHQQTLNRFLPPAGETVKEEQPQQSRQEQGHKDKDQEQAKEEKKGEQPQSKRRLSWRERFTGRLE